MSTVTLSAREIGVKILFPYDEAVIDSTYMDNRERLQIIDSLLSVGSFSKIEFKAQSSPEGPYRYNERLSEHRRQSIERYFRSSYPQIDSAKWSFIAVAEDWEEFRQQLVDDESLPNSEEILAVVDSDREPDAKEWLLRTMEDGKSWRYIKESILPTQRYGATVLFTPSIMPLAQEVSFLDELTIPLLQFDNVTPKRSPKTIVAIKTNMLLDALSIVNLAVEVPIGNRWSVVGEVVYPWWRSWSSDFTMQIESYHGELKYWLGDREKRERLQGWSVGVYGGWGRYDVQPFGDSGVQGSFTDFGVEIGFAHSIARNLHLEYNLGLGYLSTSYDRYNMVDQTEEYGDIKVIPYPWMNNSLKSIFPTRCGISLVWTIKSGGRR
ncbi:MAG: DUF3575 domain-containing protein [Rikenellaceae bacterium]